MDSNIDPNIDPSIESQSGLFTKFSINHDFNNDEQDNEQVHDDFINHQYIEDNNETNSNNAAATAAAAAAAAANLSNIINFNNLQSLQDRSNTSSPTSHPTSNTSSRSQDHINQASNISSSQQNRLLSQNNNNDHNISHNQRDGPSQDPLNFIHDTLTSLDHENNQSSGQIDTQSEAYTSDFKKNQPKQRIVHDANSQFSMVVVNPASTEGTRRLGRPRKNMPKRTHSPQNSSSQNLDKSLLSRFRFDSLPVVGPGSRGGRKKKNNIVSKPGRQARFGKNLTLVVNKDEDDNAKDDIEEIVIDGDESMEKLSSQEKSKKDTGKEDDKQKLGDKKDDDLIVVDEVDKQLPAKTQPKIILEDYHTLKAKGRSTAKDYRSDAFTKLGLVPQTNNNKKQQQQHLQQKKRREIPGPVTGAYYDIYDPYTAERVTSQNDEDMNLIALGFEVRPAPYAKDIMTILEFTNKFKSVFSDFTMLGPQDFEEGLKLRPSTKYPLENVKQKTAEKLYDGEQTDETASTLMNGLFYLLLTLVLNRKRPIDKNSFKRGLEDLKMQVLTLGLPLEWRDDSDLFSEPPNSQQQELPTEADKEPVDPENTEIFDMINQNFGTTKPLDHTPLDNEDFESKGLNSLEPKDRLILLRSLTQWSLTSSEIIKQELSSQLAKQESSGEKETYYISKYVKDGPKAIETALQEKARLAKKKQQQAQQKIVEKNSPTPEIKESDINTDPASNPLDHHMSFRLLDFYAGDGGINGRFYLCRSSNSKTGGFATFQEITSILEDNKSIHDLLTYEQPSRFKLYVQDVTTMLTDLYKTEASFDESTGEVLDPWYEIASDTTQLGQFLEHLSTKLSNNRSKQLTNLYNYLSSLLPILTKFETIQKDYRTTRSSRKREPITDYRQNDKKLKQMIEDGDEEDHDFLNSDDEEEEEDFE